MKKTLSILAIFIAFILNAQTPAPKGIWLKNATELKPSSDSVRIAVLNENGVINSWINKDSLGGGTPPDLSSYLKKDEINEVTDSFSLKSRLSELKISQNGIDLKSDEITFDGIPKYKTNVDISSQDGLTLVPKRYVDDKGMKLSNWTAGATYNMGEIVLLNGVIYRSLVNGNQGNLPSAVAGWVKNSTLSSTTHSYYIVDIDSNENLLDYVYAGDNVLVRYSDGIQFALIKGAEENYFPGTSIWDMFGDAQRDYSIGYIDTFDTVDATMYFAPCDSFIGSLVGVKSGTGDVYDLATCPFTNTLSNPWERIISIEEYLSKIQGYSENIANQSLKKVNGIIQWVND